jgi:putative ABC transport system ATP-binding protein
MNKLLYSENAIKSFGSGGECRNALNGVSVEIADGEFVAVMGPSGSGKSTLLYVLSGMEHINVGDVAFDGKKLSGLSDDALSDLRRKKMGFVFQQPTLLKNLNILDNILLPQMRDKRKDVKELTAKARALMKQVGIAHLEGRDITQASGGELQRAGICRALMNSPKIMFADEPTGALNAKSSDEIMTLFSEIHQNGTAILLVTHDAKVAARAQRVLFMRDGRIVSELSPRDWTSRYLAGKTKQVLLEIQRLEI